VERGTFSFLGKRKHNLEDSLWLPSLLYLSLEIGFSGFKIKQL